jgi:NADPH2:quinone reductase
VEEKAVIMDAVRDAVWPLLTDGRIRPLVAKTFPLEQVQAAHSYFDSGDHVGKVLLLL